MPTPRETPGDQPSHTPTQPSTQPPTQPPPHTPQGMGSARAVARLLDRSFRVPGTSLRFGLDPILGLLPIGGDAIAALASGYILYIAWRNGAPGSLIGRMLVNVLIDSTVGSIPVLGDIFDAGWQANVRNMALLENWIDDDEGPARPGSPAILIGVVVALVVLVAGVAWALWAMGAALF